MDPTKDTTQKTKQMNKMYRTKDTTQNTKQMSKMYPTKDHNTENHTDEKDAPHQRPQHRILNR
jgi:hypothetical protein